MDSLPQLPILLCDAEEKPYLDGTERKIFFLAPRGFSVRKLPENVRDLFARFDFVCADDRGTHFGRGIVRDDVTVADALAVLSTFSGLLILPPHSSTEPVPAHIIEALQQCAPDFGVLHGFTARQVVNAANQARGFPPFALTR